MPNESIEPIYQAKYRHGVDDKRRVQVPAKWRPADEGIQFALVLWPHNGQPDACLLVLPPKAFADFVQKITAMPFADRKAEALRRILGEKSDTVQLDKAGRICVPEDLAAAAGIKVGMEVVLVGLLDRFEIWESDRYARVNAADDVLAAEAFKLME